jgi:hypothetical protein
VEVVRLFGQIFLEIPMPLVLVEAALYMKMQTLLWAKLVALGRLVVAR